VINHNNLSEILTPIWEQIFRRTSIYAGENFFDLGGDPHLAVQLFRLIENATGYRFSPLLVYQAPTIASLAALLQSPGHIRSSQCLLLKHGQPQVPLFLLHGLGGNVMEFFSFVKHLDTLHSVYGLQARGIDGVEEPCLTIQAMANYHLSSVKTIHPVGPYLLIGYSLGGLVALEMARLLMEAGESVPLLVMIDSYPPLRFVPTVQRLGVYSRRLKLRVFRKSDPTYSKYCDSLGIDFTPAMVRVREASTEALREYRPRYYSGTIRFIKADTPSRFPDNPQGVWGEFVGQMRVDSAPGDHHTMLATHFVQLADRVSGYLKEFQVQKAAGVLDI
jgi:pimeloyl-ACP methyl ester carboxylesterase